MFEITQVDSRVYGGGDGLAINRHSEREYLVRILNENNKIGMVDGTEKPIEWSVFLDKVLDCDPPYYTLYFFLAPIWGAKLPEYIEVDGKQEWGDGWSWAKAKDAAVAAIKDVFGG